MTPVSALVNLAGWVLLSLGVATFGWAALWVFRTGLTSERCGDQHPETVRSGKWSRRVFALGAALVLGGGLILHVQGVS